MKNFQHEWCAKILEKLDKKPTSGPFKNPVPLDNNPRYNEIVKFPMNLEQVKLSLQNDKYHTIMEFAADVRLIWYNSMCYYPQDDPKYIIAMDLSKWFENKLQNYPQNVNERWMMKFKKLHARIKNLLNNPIPSMPSIDYQPPEIPQKKDSTEKTEETPKEPAK